MTTTLLTFFVASVLLALTPGPDNLFVITHSVLRGWKSGFAVVLGLCTGLLVHTTAVVLGVAVLLQTSTWAFIALKTAGAVYLLYLAWQAFTATVVTGNAEHHTAGFLWSYRRGIIMNVTNPKVSLFFLAFLPQFVDPNTGSTSLQIVVLGGVFIIATILVFGSLSLMAGLFADLFSRSVLFNRSLNIIAGLIFTGLATYLVISG